MNYTSIRKRYIPCLECKRLGNVILAIGYFPNEILGRFWLHTAVQRMVSLAEVLQPILPALPPSHLQKRADRWLAFTGGAGWAELNDVMLSTLSCLDLCPLSSLSPCLPHHPIWYFNMHGKDYCVPICFSQATLTSQADCCHLDTETLFYMSGVPSVPAWC